MNIDIHTYHHTKEEAKRCRGRKIFYGLPCPCGCSPLPYVTIQTMHKDGSVSGISMEFDNIKEYYEIVSLIKPIIEKDNGE